MSPAAHGAAESWDSRLDRFAACLAEQRAALEAGRLDDVRTFEPGLVTEPLPVRLLPQARELQAQSAQLEHDVSHAMAGVARQLQLLAALSRDSDEPRTRLLDHSA
jgi:hypothetical protein